MNLSGLSSDLRETWLAHPGRLLPLLLAFAAALTALLLLSAARAGLARRADTLLRSLGADSFLVHAPDGWTRPQADAVRADLAPLATAALLSPLIEIPSADPALPPWHLVAADSTLAATRSWRPAAGRLPDPADDAPPASRLAWLPESLARARSLRVGALFAPGGSPLRVAGVLRGDLPPLPDYPPDTLFLPAASPLPADLAPAAPPVDTLLVRARPGRDPADVLSAARASLARLEATLPPPRLPLRWTTPDHLLAGLRRWNRALSWTLGFAGLLALLMASATLVALQLLSVRERVPEIGLRRSLGASPRDIAALFLAETLSLLLASTLLALLALRLLLPLAAAHLPAPPECTFATLALPLLPALLLPLLFAALPAAAAARLPPSDALRA